MKIHSLVCLNLIHVTTATLIAVFLTISVSVLAGPIIADDSSQSGLGVFGKTLGLHGKLQVRGDVILNSAEIVGDGELILNEIRPSVLVAEASSVNKLTIDNPAGILLKGELTINEQLVIKHGLFEAGFAQLYLNDSCLTTIHEGGQLKQSQQFTDFDNHVRGRLNIYNRDVWINKMLIHPKRLTAGNPVVFGGEISLLSLSSSLLSPNYPPPELAYIPHR